MIKEFEFYHGTIFSKLIHYFTEGISIKQYQSSSNASYIFNNEIGIYIKHSTKRMSPWRYNFLKIHIDEILKISKDFEFVFILLVCEKDGVVILSLKDFKHVLDINGSDSEWISVSRLPGKEYTIKGSKSELKNKVGKTDLLKKIEEALKN